MEVSSSSEALTHLPPLEFAQSPEPDSMSIADSSEEMSVSTPSEEVPSSGRSQSRPDSISSADTVKFPTLPSTDSADTHPSEELPPALESSRSSLSTSTSVTTSELDTPCTSILRTASSSSLPTAHPKIPSILRTSTSFTLPKRSTSGSIVFAPLPDIEPRKRTSTVALGVAARSRLLRHRKMMRENGYDPDEMPPWTEDDVAEQSEREVRRRRHHARHGDVEEDPFGAEDAVAAMSKAFKDAGRVLFRRWSKKQKAADYAEPEKEPAVVVRGETFVESPRESTEDAHEEPRSEVGGVWEEEIGTGTWVLSEGTASAPEIKVTPSAPSRRSSMLFIKKGAATAGGKAR